MPVDESTRVTGPPTGLGPEEKTPTAPRDLGYAPSKWAFDDEVTRVFEDMLWRSIPHYVGMRDLCHEFASKFRVDGTVIVDLGCSRGGAISKLVDRFGDRNYYVGAEVSQPMVDAARARVKAQVDSGFVSIQQVDLRGSFPSLGPAGAGGASVVQAVLTLQFIPIEHRQRVVRRAYESLRAGGALILVEKVLGSTTLTNDLLVDAYYEFKRGNGYSQDEIDRKRLALEGVLVPQTEAANVAMLRAEGFDEVECVWRYLNFCGWVAVKR